MYVVVVLLQKLVLPLVSGAIELAAEAGAGPILVFGRWFLFWGFGTRLLLAGVAQIVHRRVRTGLAVREYPVYLHPAP